MQVVTAFAHPGAWPGELNWTERKERRVDDVMAACKLLHGDDVRLIGVRHPTGKVSIYAAGVRRSGWQYVNPLVFALATEINSLYDSAEYDRRPGQITVLKRFNFWPSSAACEAARQLLALECGINAGSDSLDRAIRQVQLKLEAVGTMTCDLTYHLLLDCYMGADIAVPA
jgi:hypothetical protein